MQLVFTLSSLHLTHGEGRGPVAVNHEVASLSAARSALPPVAVAQAEPEDRVSGPLCHAGCLLSACPVSGCGASCGELGQAEDPGENPVP